MPGECISFVLGYPVALVFREPVSFVIAVRVCSGGGCFGCCQAMSAGLLVTTINAYPFAAFVARTFGYVLFLAELADPSFF